MNKNGELGSHKIRSDCGGLKQKWEIQRLCKTGLHKPYDSDNLKLKQMNSLRLKSKSLYNSRKATVGLGVKMMARAQISKGFGINSLPLNPVLILLRSNSRRIDVY